MFTPGFWIVDQNGRPVERFETQATADSQLTKLRAENPDAQGFQVIVGQLASAVLKFDDNEVPLSHDDTFLLDNWLDAATEDHDVATSVSERIWRAHGKDEMVVLSRDDEPDEAEVVLDVLEAHVADIDSESPWRFSSRGSGLRCEADRPTGYPEGTPAHRIHPNPASAGFCVQATRQRYSAEMWRPLFDAALKAAGIHDRVRPFHDLRHTAITNRAVAGLSPIVLMYEAGHSSMAITQRYIDFAGVTFADEAAQAERRMLGAVSTERSTDLSEPQDTEQDAAGSTARE